MRLPLAKGQAVSIGLTSYDGKVCYGLNADRDAMPDVDVLEEAIGRIADFLEDYRHRAGTGDLVPERA